MTKYDHKFPVIKFIYLNCGYVTHNVFLCLAGSENVLYSSLFTTKVAQNQIMIIRKAQ